MGFGEDHAARDAASRLRAVRAGKLVKEISEYREARPVDAVETELTQRVGVSQKTRVPSATVQIGNNMQTVQFA